MRVDRSEKVRAGIFVLVSITLLVVIVVLVAGLRVFKRTKTQIVRFNESVTGLEVSSIVRYQGVPVGRVASIGFAKDEFPKIDVIVELDPTAPVKTDTRAALKPQGITGLNYIDLSGGSADKPLLPEGGTIVADQSTIFLLVQSLGDMGEAVKKVSKIADTLDGLITANEDRIGVAVDEMIGAAKGAREVKGSREFLKEMRGFLKETRNDLRTTIDNANGTLVAMRSFTEREDFQAIPGRVSKFLDQYETLARNLDEKVKAVDVKATVESIQALVSRVETLEREAGFAVREFRRNLTANSGVLARAMSDIKQFTQNMKLLSREVRSQPSRLFFDAPQGTKGRDR
jgi:ABC-type transporter Mla subunit MlaD